MTNLLSWKGYHGLIYLYMPYKQNGTPMVLPPLVVPTSGLAHGLICWRTHELWELMNGCQQLTRWIIDAIIIGIIQSGG